MIHSFLYTIIIAIPLSRFLPSARPKVLVRVLLAFSALSAFALLLFGGHERAEKIAVYRETLGFASEWLLKLCLEVQLAISTVRIWWYIMYPRKDLKRVALCEFVWSLVNVLLRFKLLFDRGTGLNGWSGVSCEFSQVAQEFKGHVFRWFPKMENPPKSMMFLFSVQYPR